MLSVSIKGRKKRCIKGFTIIELIVVISIIGILATIAVPSFNGYVEKSKEKVCEINCLNLRKIYETYLIMGSAKHSDTIFTIFKIEYGQGACPAHGEMDYANGEIRCKIHYKGDDKEEDDGSVPYL